MKVQTPKKSNRHNLNDIDLEEIKCSICCEIYDTKLKIPVSLPSCGHTFCLSCVQQGLKQKSDFDVEDQNE